MGVMPILGNGRGNRYNALAPAKRRPRREDGPRQEEEMLGMDFIERLFGIAPDGGSGWLEFLLFAVPLAGVAWLWQRRRAARRDDDDDRDRHR
jgi:hypothetical protein